MKIGELIFIGMGLGLGDGISLRALNKLEMADIIYLETYTGLVRDPVIEVLSKRVGKKIIPVDRKTVEDGAEILKSAKENDSVALVVLGDPLSATTHVDLRLRAFDEGLPTDVIEGSSIFTAAPGLCGLSHYKFGRTTTLAFPHGDYFPESPYDLIGENQKSGLHSLVLLEFTIEENRIMTANDGLKILLQLEERKGEGLVKDDTLCCVVARAGSNDALVKAGLIKDLVNEDFGEPMHCLVIPGKLHFKEAEALVKLCDAPRELMDKVD